MEKVIEGIRINIQRSTKKMLEKFSPDEAVVSITIPAKSVSVKLIDSLITLADEALIKEVKKWGKELALEELPSEKVKEIEAFVKEQLEGD